MRRSTTEASSHTPVSRLGLSREYILEEALKLLDRDGLDAFSMRRLGNEMGIGTMTLYGYFPNRDALLDGIIDASASKLVTTKASGSWKERLRELMLSLRRALTQHPAIAELRRSRPLISPGALEVTETAMRILRQAGFSKAEAARTYRVLYIFAFGFAGYGPGARSEETETLEALSGLPADTYPVLADCAGEAAASMADETVFELGLDYLLDGLEKAVTGSRRDAA
jgi:AcrR family transcriptional regulator